MLKIVITGPEASGKSTLCQQISNKFNVDFVLEYSRDYLIEKGGQYQLQDLLNITIGQEGLIAERAAQSPKILIIDTAFLVLKIWAEEKYGGCPKLIEDKWKNFEVDHFLLCKPDIPWEPDPLRENPHDRDRLFDIYEQYLKKAGHNYTIIEGSYDERLSLALFCIKNLSAL